MGSLQLGWPDVLGLSLPMSIPQNRFVLRPLELKHLFDFAIRLLRFNFIPMLLSMAMVNLPIALLGIPLMIRFVGFAEKFQDPTVIGSMSELDILNTILVDQLDWLILGAFGLLFIALYQLLVTPLGLLTCARLAARALDGHRDSFAEAFRFAQTRYWATQVALATFFLPTVVVAFIVLLLVLAANAIGGQTLLIAIISIGVFLIFVMLIATPLMYFRFFPVLSGVLQASEENPEEGMVSEGLWYMRRSFGLTMGHYFRIVMMMFLLSIACNMIQSGLRSSIEMLMAVYDYMSKGSPGFSEYLISQSEGQTDPMQLGIMLALVTVFTVIFPPYWQCFKLLLYNDLRCRKEALDIYRLLDDEQAA
jgi:hypothetical protein